MNNLEKSQANILRAVVRIANYFDRCSVAPFDELNIISDSNFQNDLYNALNSKKSKNCPRDETINKSIHDENTKN